MAFFGDAGRVLAREWGRIRRYPIHIMLAVILPGVAFSFFVAFFSKGVATDIPVAVVDHDNTPMSRTLVRMIDATASASVDYGLQELAEGENMMKEGRIQAVVYIPDNFEKDILGNVGTNVAAYISGMNISANGLLFKDIQTVVTTYASGIQIQLLMRGGLSEKQAYAQMMPVHFDKHVLFNPYINYGYYLLPSFLPMMLMVFTLMLTIFAIGSELKNSTAGEWFAAAGGRTIPALAGKLLPYTLIMMLVGVVMNTIMYRWYGVPLNGSLAMLTVAVFMFVLAYQAIGVLIITVLCNLRLSLSLGGGYSVLAFTFSGLTFPLMAMDPYMRAFSNIFPFTFYTDVFVDQAMRGAPVGYSLQYLGWMSLFILLPMLCLPRLKKIATHKEYWGRL